MFKSQKIQFVVSIIFSITLLLGSIGVNIDSHTCGKKGITSIQIMFPWSEVNECMDCHDPKPVHSCCMVEEEKTKECCDDKHDFIKTDIDLKHQVDQVKIEVPVFTIDQSDRIKSFQNINDTRSEKQRITYPPPNCIHLLNQVFII